MQSTLTPITSLAKFGLLFWSTTQTVLSSANPNEAVLTASITPSRVLKVVPSPCTSRMKPGINLFLYTIGVFEHNVRECQAGRIIPNSLPESILVPWQGSRTTLG